MPPDKVSLIWPRVDGLIFTAMKKGGIGSFAAVQRVVLEGKAQLWLAISGQEIEAAAVTELMQTEWRLSCNVLACAGREMERWVGLLDKIEDFARVEGCSVVHITGRHGWERVLTAYRPTRVILEKRL